MADLPQRAIPLAAPADVTIDHPCFFCGYNLRTLALDGVCPECGNRVQESLCLGLLACADPVWLRRLRTGITIPLWMMLAAFLLYVAFAVWIASTAMSAALASSQAPPDLLPALAPAAICLIGLILVSFVSVWYLTSPEPLRDKSPQQTPLATWIRGLGFASAALSIVLIVTALGLFYTDNFGLLGRNDSASASLRVSFFMGITLCGVSSWVGFLLQMIHLRRIARRHPGKGLRRLMTLLIWTTVGLIGFSALAVLPMSRATRRLAATSMPAPSTLVSSSVVSPAAGAAAPSSPDETGEVNPSATIFAETPSAAESRGDTKAHRSLAGATPPERPEDSSSAGQGPDSKLRPRANRGPVYDANSPFSMAGTPTSMPVVARRRAPGWLAPVLFAGVCLVEVLALAWGIAYIVSLFWFRVVLSKAIRENVFPSLPA